MGQAARASPGRGSVVELETSRPFPGSMQKSEDLDAFVLDPVGNEKWSGENHQLTSSGNSTTPSGFGMAFQHLDRGKNAFQHLIRCGRGTLTGPVIISGVEMPRGPTRPYNLHYFYSRRHLEAIALTLR